MVPHRIVDHPFLVFVLSVFVLWLSVRVGAFFRQKRSLEEGDGDYFAVILTATLTLLGLIIGFSFSMALGRYDQRKQYEEQEANAIGTEYVRAQLLPAAEAEKVTVLLRQYLKQRILFYEMTDNSELQRINADTARLQAELWSAAKVSVSVEPAALSALTLSGMNDVLNSQGYTQAAWRNRIPRAAWNLMAAIAICSTFLIGYGARRVKGETFLFLVLPVIVSIAFLLIADIDSPRGGLIRVSPENLLGLSQSLHAD